MTGIPNSKTHRFTNPKLGVVPPTASELQTSSRSAPPDFAAAADANESMQISSKTDNAIFHQVK